MIQEDLPDSEMPPCEHELIYRRGVVMDQEYSAEFDESIDGFLLIISDSLDEDYDAVTYDELRCRKCQADLTTEITDMDWV